MRAIPVAALLLLAACVTPGAETAGPTAGQALAGSDADVAKYYPLAVGNTWYFKGKLLGQPAENRVTVTKKDGAVYIDDKGGQLMIDGDGLRDRKRYLLKAPIVKGGTWMSVASLASVEKFEIVDTARAASVEAGRFDGCVVVRGKNRIDPQKEFVTEWTYAPGIGIVKIETFILKNGKDYIPQGQLELSSFELKPESK